ncbi:hypothetical protein HNY73_015924 [Argiope bruennichi]|uniref:THAP-type domain-containing protein n=1 Tax=Argiope bruennichi TaxID=94029 RepID=A0A8T0EHI0_ARGBR|nr:hypothetical protein HNY73_015924 [Argiope bruennichi]
MKTCAVRSCGNDSNKRRDLCFFNIPKDPVRREEWLEVLGINPRKNINNLTVCEIHFKEKDFKSGKKKVLKSHVIPVLNLGQIDPVDSDEYFIHYDIGNDPEIFEFQDEMSTTNNQVVVKKEPVEEKPDQEPAPDLEQETGRRPSRRAAIVAAKKIFNTVRNLSITDNPADHSVNLSPSPKPVSVPHPYSRSKPKKNTPPPPPPEPSADINVDLEMECYEELLSPVQNEFLYDAQVQYNINMKNFRELVADNVKIIQTDANGVPIFVTSSLNRNQKRGNVAVNSKSARNKPVNTNSAMVVPMRLIQAPIMIT